MNKVINTLNPQLFSKENNNSRQCIETNVVYFTKKSWTSLHKGDAQPTNLPECPLDRTSW